MENWGVALVMTYCIIWCYMRLCSAKWLQNTVGEAVGAVAQARGRVWWCVAGVGTGMCHDHPAKPTADQHWGCRCWSGSCRWVAAVAVALRRLLTLFHRWHSQRSLFATIKLSTWESTVHIIHFIITYCISSLSSMWGAHDGRQTSLEELGPFGTPVATPLYPLII